MAGQILVFEKNKLDLSNSNVVITASQGQSYVDYMRNRNNLSAWITTGSVDADLTNVVFDFGEARSVTDIVMVKHNLKAFTLQYWNGSSYVDFSTPVSETTNDDETSHFSFDEVTTQSIKLVVQGTMTPDADKRIFQFIATTRIGQFTGWPVISGAEHDRNRTLIQALSGKSAVNENVGGFKCTLKISYSNIANDIALIEELFNTNQGFLVWLCGGDESQFTYPAKGYRMEDLFLMKCTNEYSPDWYKGMYRTGLDLTLKLSEVVD